MNSEWLLTKVTPRLLLGLTLFGFSSPAWPGHSTRLASFPIVIAQHVLIEGDVEVLVDVELLCCARLSCAFTFIFSSVSLR